MKAPRNEREARFALEPGPAPTWCRPCLARKAQRRGLLSALRRLFHRP